MQSKFQSSLGSGRASRFTLLTITIALGGPLLGQVKSFEAASVKLSSSNERGRVSAIPGSGRFTMTATAVRDVILAAYGLRPFELIGNGSPILTQRIDIVAKADAAATIAEMQRMLQPLLAERFKLSTHRENREMDALVIVRARQDRLGPKLVQSTTDCNRLGVTNSFAREELAPPTAGQARCGIAPGGIGRIIVHGMDMPGILGFIFTAPRPAVVDQTGLDGRWDVDVTYTPEAFTTAALARRGASAPDGVNPDGPLLFTALDDQLGLKVEQRRASVPVVVIDHIEPLSPE